MIKKLIAVSGLTIATLLSATVSAGDVEQNCILKGVVNKAAAADRGLTVYVDFKSAKPATRKASCDLSRGEALKADTDVLQKINNLPHGTRVSYEYTLLSDQTTEWKLLTPDL